MLSALPQNSQQKSVPDLNVLTVAFLALKKMVFLKKKILPKKNIFFYLFSMQLFSADATMFSIFFALENKKRPQKLLIIGPKLFFHVLAQLPKPAQN